MIPIGYSGAKGKLIRGKNMKSKISCQTPFKPRPVRNVPVVLCR
jgi:hypothetical protein